MKEAKKGWQFYDLDTREYFVSRDVKFYERVFSYAIASNELMGMHTKNGVTDVVWEDDVSFECWKLGTVGQGAVASDVHGADATTVAQGVVHGSAAAASVVHDRQQ